MNNFIIRGSARVFKLKDLIKRFDKMVEEGFSKGTLDDKNNTKNRSEKVGYKMVGEDDKPTFDLSNESDRGDAEFASGNLKSIDLKEWTEKDEADGTIKRWSKPYGKKYTEYEVSNYKINS